jgi:hypothetical protein
MVLYTCFKKVNTNYYICHRGVVDTNEENLIDYRIISVPPSNLTYEILRSIDEIYMLKLTLKDNIKLDL